MGTLFYYISRNQKAYGLNNNGTMRFRLSDIVFSAGQYDTLVYIRGTDELPFALLPYAQRDKWDSDQYHFCDYPQFIADQCFNSMQPLHGVCVYCFGDSSDSPFLEKEQK